MTVNVKTNNNTKALVEPDNISNPNLLINPDFKINQRGQTSYDFSTKSGYTVDRWFISRSKLTINSDNTITVDFTTNGGVINQQLETVLNEQHTASINITKITGSIRFYIGTSKFITITSPGIYTITHDTDITQVSLYNPTGNNTTASCTIKWVKLEKGPIATQFVSPDIATELVKCQRYYQYINLDTKSCAIVNNIAYSRIYGISMRKSITGSFDNDGNDKLVRLGNQNIKINSISAFSDSDINNNISLVYNLEKNINGIALSAFTKFHIILNAEIY